MGTLIEGLDDHEGYVLWRLADGVLTSAWTLENRRQLTAYVAECECGWRSTREHPATELMKIRPDGAGLEPAIAPTFRDPTHAGLHRAS